jgi:recombination protein RecR
MNIPLQVQSLIETLRHLPSLGPRQATRLAFYLTGAGKTYGQELAKSIMALSDVSVCAHCFFICNQKNVLCEICSDPERNKKQILILEKETDLLSIEDTGIYKGTYLIIGSIPKTGILSVEHQKRLQITKTRIKHDHDGIIDEMIMGFGPSTLSDFHADIIIKELRGWTKKISRLGRGLPTGAEIEFADPDTLSASFDTRR